VPKKEKYIVVLGDVMLDHYVMGEHNRNSPEADVAVLENTQSIYKMGGAANVAANLKSIRSKPYLLSVIGNDKDGIQLNKLLKQKKISSYILKDKGRPTTTKTRFVNSDWKQFLRVDKESKKNISQSLQIKLLKHFTELLRKDQVAALIIQDYNKGVISSSIVRAIKIACKNAKIPIMVDPNLSFYLAAHCLNPIIKN